VLFLSLLYLYNAIARHVTLIGERRGAYRILVGKPEGKIPLVRPRSRWENNIKMDLQGIGR